MSHSGSRSGISNAEGQDSARGAISEDTPVLFHIDGKFVTVPYENIEVVGAGGEPNRLCAVRAGDIQKLCETLDIPYSAFRMKLLKNHAYYFAWTDDPAMARFAPKKPASMRDLYIAGCQVRIRKDEEEARRALEKADQEIARCMRELAKWTQEREDAAQKAGMFAGPLAGYADEYGNEFDMLQKQSAVEKLEIHNNFLHMFTDMICIEDGSSLRRIGEFRVEISMQGSQNGHLVRAFNLSGSVENFFHPHIRSSGECCLGNISDSIAKLVGTSQSAIAGVLMLQFLESYNGNSAYRKAACWPKASAKEQKEWIKKRRGENAS